MSSVQCKNLTTVSIKLDGKTVSIDDLPKKPKSLNLFQNYCAELGVSGNELKNREAELKKLFKENKASYLEKNKKLIESHNQEMKEYRELFKKKVQLKDVAGLIQFYHKVIAKENTKKSRKPSLFNIFVKKSFATGQAKSIQDMKQISENFHNLSPSELESLKQYEENISK